MRSSAAPPLPLVAGLALCLFGVTLLLFARSASNGFVTLDDPSYVLQNPPVRAGLTLPGIAWAFTHVHSFNWHPLTWTSHMLDVSLFGVAPAGHHLVSAALHAANAALLFLALVRMTGSPWPSALAAALFALHPLRVESVAWVAERKDVLSGLLAMGTLLAWEAYARRGGAQRYGAALACFALGLLCKPMLVTLPAVLLLLDFWPLRRKAPLGRLLGEKLPFAALAVASSVVTWLAQASGGAVRGLEVVPLGARLANALIAAVAYLGKALWPARLAVFYPHPALLGRADALWLPALGAAALLLAATAVSVRGARRRPWLLVGWLWYLVTLVPVLGVVQVGGQAMADRYTYLPMIGIAIAASWGVAELAGRFSARACAACAAAALVACAGLTWRQIGVWRDSETLFRHAILATRDNYLAHTYLASVLRVRGRSGEARAELERAIAIKPGYVPARLELAGVRIEEGDLDGADELLAQLLRERPGNARAQHELGRVRLAQGRLAEAEACFERTLRLSPEFAEAEGNLGLVYRRQGRREEAVRAFRRALALRPDAAFPRQQLRELGAAPDARAP